MKLSKEKDKRIPTVYKGTFLLLKMLPIDNESLEKYL